jgi:hypothetical protein
MSYQPPYQQQQQQHPSQAAYGAYPPYGYASPQMMGELPHSKLGIASFIIALVVGIGEFTLLIVAGVMETSTPGGIDEESPKAMVLGMLLLFGLLLALIGAILAITGLFEGSKKRVFPIIGLCINGLILLLVVVLLVVGATMG